MLRAFFFFLGGGVLQVWHFLLGLPGFEVFKTLTKFCASCTTLDNIRPDPECPGSRVEVKNFGPWRLFRFRH